MKIKPSIFHAYDVRGVYPEEVNEEAAYLIGLSLVEFLQKPGANIVVGRDNRISSDVLFESLARGIIDSGANVVDIGLSTTPLLYFACGFYGYDGGINITASHNPGQYNGFKFVGPGAVPIGENSGLLEIKEIALKNDFKEAKKGKISKKNALSDYIKFNFKNFNFKSFKKLKITIDTANAVAGIIVPDLKKSLGAEINPLFLKLDGAFPNHNPDPLTEDNLKFLKEEILAKKSDLGVAFDGDGDRIFFIDEKAQAVGGDLTSAFLAERILKENPGEKIVYDIRCSNIVRETILKNNGQPILNRVGHSFIKETMRRENALFGGEFAGHFYHRDHYFCEAPLFALFTILEAIVKEQKPFSELILPFRKYYTSGEINFETNNKEVIINSLEKEYQNGKMLKIDGLRVDFDDWWFLVRPSQTEPKLRLSLEAKTKELLEEKKEELTRIIKI